MKVNPVNATPLRAEKKTSSGIMTTVIILLLIGLAVMGVMTAKKFLDTQRTTVDQADINTLSKIVDSNSDNVQARLSLAYAYQRAGRYDEARDEYMQVLQLDPKNEGAFYNLGEIARINKDYGEATKRLEWLMSNYKDHVLGSISLAQVYLDTQKYDKALSLMNHMISYDPTTVDFYLLKGKALDAKGDKVNAKAAYKMVLKYDPENATAKQALKGRK